MQVLIMADAVFASHERGLLSRLEVGLADEGVRAVHGIPARVAAAAGESGLTRCVRYEDAGMAITRGVRVRRLLGAIGSSEHVEGDHRALDVVHVFGGSMWAFAREVARQSAAALVCDVWRVGLVEPAALMAREDPAPLFLAPDPAIERALVEAGPRLMVRPAPWGVHTPPEARAILPPGRTAAVVLIGTGLERRAFLAAFAGAAGAAEHHDLMIFIDARAAARSGLWASARRLNVLDRVSLIEEIETRRDMLLQADVLLVPEAAGEQRTVVLEAMAAGLAVVAAADPYVSALADGKTARLVAAPAREAAPWRAVIEDLLGDPTGARRLGQSARQFARTHRKASGYVRAVLDAYAWLRSRQAIPFPQVAVQA